jgi:putative inorganic carbon (hco3(-)) transporter
MTTAAYRISKGGTAGTPPLIALLGPIAFSLAAFHLSLWLAEGGLKRWIIAGALTAIPFVLVVYPKPKHLLLFGWIFTTTYNRQYFTFEGIFGNHGSQGAYWIVSDIFLLALLLWLVYERVYCRKTAEPRGSRFWPWYLPFVLTCILSIAGAARPDWGAFELVRLAKFAFIIWYVRRYLDRREWWICVAAMAAAMTFQSLVGVKEIVTGRSGVIGMEQAPAGPGKFSGVFSQESFYGSVRATGTMNHPPNLACYLLLVLPIPLSLLLGCGDRRLRNLALLAAAAGVAGLACTLSRWPWALAVGQCAILAAAMVWTSRISAKRMAGIAILACVAGAIALIPVRDKLVKRFTGDFSESVDQRVESSRVAMEIIRDFPLTGVGLNNSAHHLVSYFPKIRWALENDEFLVSKVNSRALAVVGNGFFYVPVETGAAGTAGFLFFLFGIGVVCARSLRGTPPNVQLVCIGMTVGLLGVLGQQLVDFSFWVDPLYYTSALVIGLISVSPGLFPRSQFHDPEGLNGVPA